MFDVTRLRIRGPLSGSAPDLAVWLAGKGYRDNTVGFLARLLARLSEWLDAEALAVAELDWAQVDRFVGWCHGVGRRQPGSRQAMKPLVEFLIESGQVTAGRFAAAVPAAGSAEGVARAFVDYLVAFRGVTTSTAQSYEAFAPPCQSSNLYSPGAKLGSSAWNAGGTRSGLVERICPSLMNVGPSSSSVRRTIVGDASAASMRYPSGFNAWTIRRLGQALPNPDAATRIPNPFRVRISTISRWRCRCRGTSPPYWHGGRHRPSGRVPDKGSTIH